MTDGGDPSTRTIDQLRVTFAHGQELMEAKLENIRTELKGAATAVVLLQKRMDSQPTPDVLQEQIVALKESIKIALSSTEKAGEKTEVSTSKQIESLGARFDDMKDRLTIIEASEKGSKQTSSSTMAFAAMGLTVIGLVITVFIFLARSPT